MQMQPIMATYNNVTTDHIQQYLDENKSLILKIVESQNSGKLSECAENQSRLQRNLMYLAAIADSQPQSSPAMPGQYPPSGLMQQGAHYMQAQQQPQQMTQQQLMAARSSLMYSQQTFSLLQQQALHGQLGMSSTTTTGLHMFQSEAANAGGNSAVGTGGFPDFGRGLVVGSGKQLQIGSSSCEGHSRERCQTLYLKPASDNDGN